MVNVSGPLIEQTGAAAPPEVREACAVQPPNPRSALTRAQCAPKDGDAVFSSSQDSPTIYYREFLEAYVFFRTRNIRPVIGCRNPDLSDSGLSLNRSSSSTEFCQNFANLIKLKKCISNYFNTDFMSLFSLTNGDVHLIPNH